MERSAQPKPQRTGRPTRRRLIVLVRLVLLIYLSLLGLMMAFEERLIFFPTPYPGGSWEIAESGVEDAWFEAKDGTRLHGWYLEHSNPRAVVLFAHGNAGNITHRRDFMERMHAMSCSVLLFDYRGYGRSEGKATEEGVLADARAARAWLAKRAGVAEPDVVLVGESIGGAVMIDLAASDGARGLIVENSFSSLPDVAARHYPWIPVQLLMRSRFDSNSKIAKYQGPYLQIHGDADTIVPFELGQKLFAAANEPKRFLVIPGGDHNDPRTSRVYRAIDELIDQLAKPPSDESAKP